MPENKEWNPPKFRCKKCADVIWSRWQGQWVQCACGSIYVDQTRHYARFGGYPEDFEEVCKRCEGSLVKIPPNEPYSDEHLQCVDCDSTYAGGQDD